MKWTQIGLRMVLLFGCGGLLTLLSGFYVREIPGMFLDVAPAEYRNVSYGFPFPIFDTLAEVWTPDNLVFNAMFVWVGVLLDVLLYSFIVGMGYLVVSTVVRESARHRETNHGS